jgi:hypothetical protein
MSKIANQLKRSASQIVVWHYITGELREFMTSRGYCPVGDRSYTNLTKGLAMDNYPKGVTYIHHGQDTGLENLLVAFNGDCPCGEKHSILQTYDHTH